MVYQWKRHYFSIDAQVVGETFEEIQSRDGGITPNSVVEEARPDNSEIHNCFDWDNKAAGEKWREHQASNMLRLLIVLNPSDESEKEDKVIRAFVNIKTPEEERVYIKTIDALNNDYYRDQVLMQALAELSAFQNKYKELKELSSIFFEIEQLKLLK